MSVSGRVTLRDIAARIGVSHVTVSLALKNHPDISRARREEVQALARKMGYRPDPALSSLMVYRRGRRNVAISSSIAWINHWAHPKELRQHHEFDAYWRGACESAERFGYHLDELIWPEDCSPERFEKILLTRNIRGILIPPHRSQPEWGSFHWENFSVIRFGLSVRSPDSHVVTADQMRMVILAMQKIRDRGYERIGFVMPKDFDAHLGNSFSNDFFTSQHMLGLKMKIPP
ncbi:MAG TPA: LacI family DNA-binding transcriptional regulator, partial [Terrimicrobiaceae bacterium]|nr:LacI family DNA-binding transcriptional regulator [Terrimicrobiaceae bacterium]